MSVVARSDGAGVVCRPWIHPTRGTVLAIAAVMSRSRSRSRLESRWDRTSFGSMHARVGGPATSTSRRDVPAIVLVHGLVISSRYMVPTAEHLALHHRVLAPDLPGFGRSTATRAILRVPELADALLEWMDVCELGRAVLVGNSLGCQVVASLAARHPGRVVAAVLTGPTIDPLSGGVLAQIARALMDVPREKLSLIPHWAIDFLRAGVRRSWRTLRYALADRIEERLPAMHMPTLVVRGSRDPLVSLAWAERVTALLPHGRLLEIEGGPHAVNYSSAEELAETIGEFLRSTSGRSAAPG